MVSQPQVQTPRKPAAPARPKAKWGTPETIAAILTLIGAFGKGRTRGLGHLGAGFLQGRSARQRQREAEWLEGERARTDRESDLEKLVMSQEGQRDLAAQEHEYRTEEAGIARPETPDQKAAREGREALAQLFDQAADELEAQESQYMGSRPARPNLEEQLKGQRALPSAEGTFVGPPPAGGFRSSGVEAKLLEQLAKLDEIPAPEDMEDKIRQNRAIANAIRGKVVAGEGMQTTLMDVLNVVPKSVRTAGMGAEAKKYGADVGLEGRKYGADVGLEGRKYGADVGFKGRKYTADVGAKSRENVARINAQSREAVAERNNSTRKEVVRMRAQASLDPRVQGNKILQQRLSLISKMQASQNALAPWYDAYDDEWIYPEGYDAEMWPEKQDVLEQNIADMYAILGVAPAGVDEDKPTFRWGDKIGRPRPGEEKGRGRPKAVRGLGKIDTSRMTATQRGVVERLRKQGKNEQEIAKAYKDAYKKFPPLVGVK